MNKFFGAVIIASGTTLFTTIIFTKVHMSKIQHVENSIAKLDYTIEQIHNDNRELRTSLDTLQKGAREDRAAIEHKIDGFQRLMFVVPTAGTN